MLNAADNALLTQVTPGTPMHALLRSYWIPALRSERLEAGGEPVRVRLLGENYVAYRGPEGHVGLVDERCPHRCASMSIARNEPGGLRCIFHGWKYAPDGELIDAPTELEIHRPALMKRVRLGSYAAHDAGGLVWFFLGARDAAPPFPAFEFTGLPAGQRDIKIAILPINWLQNLESVLDSAHLATLHSSSVLLAMTESQKKNAQNWATQTAPKLEFDDTPFGFREAAIRNRADGSADVRIREVVAPFYALLPGIPNFERSIVIAVPIDDTSSLQIHVTYNPYRAFTEGEVERIWFHTHPDKNDISDPAPGPLGWPQDREAMRNGHFSGITNRHVFYEDFAVLQSMGPIVDRRFEHLSSTDMTLVRFRKGLIEALQQLQQGHGVWGRPEDPLAYSRIRTAVLDVPAGASWRSMAAPD